LKPLQTLYLEAFALTFTQNLISKMDNYVIDLVKITVVAFFGWLGLQIDVVPIAIYALLWMLESFTQMLKNIVVFRKLDFWQWILRTLRHLSVLIIPLVIVLMVKSVGQEYSTLYKSSIFMITFYISLTTIGNVVSMFTGQEYKFESIIVNWFNKLSKIKENETK
jgi:hypothetical protein